MFSRATSIFACSILATASVLTAEFMNEAAAQSTKELGSKLNAISKRVSVLEKKVVSTGQSTAGAKGPKGDRGDRGERGAQGERGAAGARGPAGPAVPTSQIQQVVGDAVIATQSMPHFHITYAFDALRFTQGTKRLAARGYIRLGSDAKWQHRIVVREATATDTTPFLENSPVIFDSDVKSDQSLQGSSFYRREGTIEAHVWLAPPSGTRKFPTLRAMVGDSSGVTAANQVKIASCAQGVIDGPFTDNVNNFVPTAGASCPFGSKITYGIAQFTNLPVQMGPGVRLAADPETAMKMCRSNGFDGVTTVQALQFASCANNTIVKWNGTTWSVINACQYNSGVNPGGLTCFKLQY